MEHFYHTRVLPFHLDQFASQLLILPILEVILIENEDTPPTDSAEIDAIHQPEHPSLFIELCQVVEGIPPKTAVPLPVSESLTPATQPDVYWQEWTRWLEFEERYDYAVNEFEPPCAPKIPYSEVSKLRNAIQKRAFSSYSR